MKTPSTKTIIKFSGLTARIKQRKNGYWMARWREGGRDRSTTTREYKDAKDAADQALRRIAAGGVKTVSVDEHRLVEKLKAIAGTRAPDALLNHIEDAARVLGGWEFLSRAVTFYQQSGMADIERVTFTAARRRFLDGYGDKAIYTLKGLRKEIQAFEVAHPNVAPPDINEKLLTAWLSRGSPSPRFFNNRLGSWKTFLNKCRVWNYIPKGEKHPAELIERKREADRVPEILTPQQAHEILALLPENLKPYFIIGAWLGLRPTEMLRLKWEHFDWDKGYLNIGAEVAQKTMKQRFVPLNAKAAGLLAPWRKATGACCLRPSQLYASAIARKAGIITEWHQDVLRHSYISYRLAQGSNRGTVAEEAGNSEKVIRSNYRRPLRREDGEAWFAVA